jgi:hypothetical protein
MNLKTAKALGSSLRAVTRLTGVSKKAVSRLMVEAGQAAAWYQDRVFRNLNCKRIQVDEIWAFVYAKQKNVAMAKAAPANAGDVWTWTAIDADTKLIPSWFVGGRDNDAAIIFMDDLASRLANRVQHQRWPQGVSRGGRRRVRCGPRLCAACEALWR